MNWNVRFAPHGLDSLSGFTRENRERLVRKVEEILISDPFAGELGTDQFAGLRRLYMNLTEDSDRYRIVFIYRLLEDQQLVWVLQAKIASQPEPRIRRK